MAKEAHATGGSSSSGLLAWGLGLVAVIGIAGHISGLGVPDRDAVTGSGVSKPAEALQPTAARPVIAGARRVLEGEDVAEATESARTTSSGAAQVPAEAAAGTSTASPPAVSTAAASPPANAAEPSASAGAAGRSGAGDGDQAIAIAGDRPHAGGDPSSALQPQAEGEDTAPAWRPPAVAAVDPVPGAADAGRQAAEREREAGTEAGTTPQGAPEAVPPPVDRLAASSPGNAAFDASQGTAESVPETKTQDPADPVAATEAAPEGASPSFRQPSAPAVAEQPAGHPTGPTDPASAPADGAEAPPASSYLWRSMSEAPSPRSQPRSRPTRPAAPMYPFGYAPGVPAPAVMGPPVLYPRWPVQGRQPIEPYYGPWGYRAYPGFVPGRDDR